jgi:hypothetical protein
LADRLFLTGPAEASREIYSIDNRSNENRVHGLPLARPRQGGGIRVPNWFGRDFGDFISSLERSAAPPGLYRAQSTKNPSLNRLI